MLIRAASPDDIELLTELHAEGFPNYWNPTAFNDFFAIAGTQGLIAEAPHPVGMVIFRTSHEQADIITLVVRREFRRRGIARLLLEKVMDAAVSAGVEAMFLDVEDGNIAALQLYEHAGFTLINRRKLYYRQKDGSYTDALVMRCKLA